MERFKNKKIWVWLILLVIMFAVPVQAQAAEKKTLKQVTILRNRRECARTVQLIWSKDKNATGYQVYRSTSKNGTYTRRKSTSKRSYTDKVTAGTTYYYKVRSYRRLGAGKYQYGKFSAPVISKSPVVSGTNEKFSIVNGTTGMYTYKNMVSDIAALRKKYPKQVGVKVAGTTADGRRIYLIRVGNKKAEKSILIESTIHGREHMNSAIVMSQIEYYLNNWNAMYNEKDTYGDILSQVCLYYMPMVNPDGVTISQYGVNGIRSETLKSKIRGMQGTEDYSRWKANARGVNLNRNFDSHWFLEGTPGATGYTGPYAFSEKETQTVRDVINSHKFSFILSYHSTGSDVWWNVGQTGKVYQESKNLAAKISNYTGYDFCGESVPEGLSYNWSMLEKKIPEIIIETGVNMCPLPAYEYTHIMVENKNLIPYLIWNYK